MPIRDVAQKMFESSGAHGRLIPDRWITPVDYRNAFKRLSEGQDFCHITTAHANALVLFVNYANHNHCVMMWL